MNRWLFSLLVVVLLLVTINGALATADLPGNTNLYWNHDDTHVIGAKLVDMTPNSRNGTITGATTGVSGIINQSFTYGANDWTTYAVSMTIRGWSWWMKPTTMIDNTSVAMAIFGSNSSAPYGSVYLGASSGDYVDETVSFYDGSVGNRGFYWNEAQTGKFAAGSWTNIIMSWNVSGDSYELYVNGSSVGLATEFLTPTEMSIHQETRCGGDYLGSDFDNGELDEFTTFNDTLNAANAATIWNTGLANQWNFSLPGNIHTLRVIDLYNDSAMKDVNVTVWNGTDLLSVLTDASGNAIFFNISSGSVVANMTFVNYTANQTNIPILVNTTSQGGMYVKNISVNVTVKITLDNITTPYNITTAGGKTYDDGVGVYALKGFDNYTFMKIGWYDFTNLIEVKDIGDDYTLTGAYNNSFTINATNSTGGSIVNFTVNVSQTDYNFSESKTTINGTLVFDLVSVLNYTFIIDAEGFAFANTTQEADNITNFYTFVLPPPEVNFSIYNELTDLLINDTTFTINIFNADGSFNENYTTSNGIFYLANTLSNDNYTVRHTSINWSNRDYYLNVGFKQNLSVRLYAIEQSESNLLPVTVTDLRGTELPNIVIHFQRWFPFQNAYTAVEMATTSEAGTTNLYFEEYDAWYIILVFNDGLLVKTLEPRRYTPEDIAIPGLKIAIDVSENAFESYIGAANMMSASEITHNNNTRAFSYTYADTAGILEEICLKVYDERYRAVNLVNETCSGASSGTLVATYPATNNTVVAKVFLATNTVNSEYLLDSFTFSWLPNTREIFGQYGTFLGAFFIASIALASGANPIVPIALTLIGLLVSVVGFGLTVTKGTMMMVSIIGLSIFALIAWRKTSS